MYITIQRDGQSYGPYSLDEARQHLASGRLLATDLAFVEGASEWTTLNSIPGITIGIPPPPKSLPLPPPPTSLVPKKHPTSKAQGSRFGA